MIRQRGFTLLELLIGMTLLGFMLALLFGGFRLASTTWDAVENRMERTSQEEMARALVRRMLTQLQPMRWKKVTNHSIAFIGEAGRIVAIAPLSGQAGGSGLRVIELVAEPETDAGKDTVRLVMRQAPVLYEAESFSDSLTAAKGHTILNGLGSVQFYYFGAEKNEIPPRWQETWTNAEQLPRLVRLRLASPGGGWADMTITPMITGGCIWDLFYNRCA
jgi:general secretion pathway protein J